MPASKLTQISLDGAHWLLLESIGLKLWTSTMILKKNVVLTGIRTTSETLDMSREKGVVDEAEGSCSYQTPRSTHLHSLTPLAHPLCFTSHHLCRFPTPGPWA